MVRFSFSVQKLEGGRGSHQRRGCPVEQAGWLLGHPFAVTRADKVLAGGMMGCASPVGRVNQRLDLATPGERRWGS